MKRRMKSIPLNKVVLWTGGRHILVRRAIRCMDASDSGGFLRHHRIYRIAAIRRAENSEVLIRLCGVEGFWPVGRFSLLEEDLYLDLPGAGE